MRRRRRAIDLLGRGCAQLEAARKRATHETAHGSVLTETTTAAPNRTTDTPRVKRAHRHPQLNRTLTHGGHPAAHDWRAQQRRRGVAWGRARGAGTLLTGTVRGAVGGGVCGVCGSTAKEAGAGAREGRDVGRTGWRGHTARCAGREVRRVPVCPGWLVLEGRAVVTSLVETSRGRIPRGTRRGGCAMPLSLARRSQALIERLRAEHAFEAWWA
jgi:hypothetical protein